VGDYGLTPERYLLGLFGVTVAVTLLLQIPKSTRGDIRILAGLPTIALFLASFGPQGEVLISVRSQEARFREAVRVKPVDEARNRQALAALGFLQSHDAVGRVAPVSLTKIDANGKLKTGGTLYNEVADAYGLDRSWRHGLNDRYFSKTFSQPVAMPIEGFDIVIPNLRILGKPSAPTTVKLPDGAPLTFAMQAGEVLVTVGAETAIFKFDTAALREFADSRDETARPLKLSDGTRTMMMLPETAYGDLKPKLNLRTLSGTLFLRGADWR
jgi:hypothetical protein